MKYVHVECWCESGLVNSCVNASLKSLLGTRNQLGGPWAAKIIFGKYKQGCGLWIPYYLLYYTIIDYDYDILILLLFTKGRLNILYSIYYFMLI